MLCCIIHTLVKCTMVVRYSKHTENSHALYSIYTYIRVVWQHAFQRREGRIFKKFSQFPLSFLLLNASISVTAHTCSHYRRGGCLIMCEEGEGRGEHWSVLHAPFLLYDSSEEAFRFYRSAPSQFLPSMPRYLAPGPPD